MIDGFRVIDGHMHYKGIFLPKEMDLISYLDERGIDGAVVNTLNTQANLSDFMKQSIENLQANLQVPNFDLFKDFKIGQPSHKEVQKLVQKHPDRIFPFFWYNPVDPTDQGKEKGIREVRDALDKGFKGVKSYFRSCGIYHGILH